MTIRGNVAVATTAIGALVSFGTAYITASSAASTQIAVVQERESNHYNEAMKGITQLNDHMSGMDKKLDEILMESRK